MSRHTRPATIRSVEARRLEIELLWWEGCPSTDAMREELERALADVGLAGTAILLREMPSEEAAGRQGFVGSPTVLIDGRDPFAPPAGEPTGLTCRIYRLRDGRFSPTPDPADLRDALRSAAASGAEA